MSRTNKPVLVVEDHNDTREMVEMFLTLDGYRVCCASHGAEALECVARETPCLILLDLTMPVMDGPTFARLLHDPPDRDLAETPIILLTAMPDAHVTMRELGAVDLSRKPFSVDQVLRVIDRYCPPIA